MSSAPQHHASSHEQHQPHANGNGSIFQNPTPFLDSASLLVFAGALLLPSLFYMAVLILVCCQCPERQRQRHQQREQQQRQKRRLTGSAVEIVEPKASTISTSSASSNVDVELQADEQQMGKEIEEHKF
ncbi:hypothetical protein niasHS_005479 [Heterodera schachtii]|uniref:Uncharacterized protein n=1 Tax=Heterodera schachtii TaxID=97005 RepID=A0ABD2JJ18_HETSC